MKYVGYLLYTAFFFIFLGGCSKNEPPLATSGLLTTKVEVRLNPYGNSPLSAEINFSTKQPVKANFKLLNTNDINIKNDVFKVDHRLAVWGLLPETENKIQISLFDEFGNTQIINKTIQTDSLPTFLPEIEITSASTKSGFYLVELHLAKKNDYWFSPFIIDNKGVVRWHTLFQKKYFSTIELLDNGNYLTAKDNEIFEMEFTGLVLNHQSLQAYYPHHDMIQLPNGNLLICVSSENESTIFDHLIEWNMTTKEILRVWNLREIYDFNRKVMSNNPQDWLHINSVWYNEKDHSITVSGRHQGIANFSYEGKLNWMLAPHLNWGKSGMNQQGIDVNQYLLTAINQQGEPYNKDRQRGFKSGENFDWVFGQHAAMINSKGNLLTFDNGWYRHYHFENPFSRIVEYSINKEQKTVQQIWQHDKVNKQNFYASLFGDVDELNNGDLLMLAGFIEGNTNRAVLQQINPANKQVNFEVQFYFKNEYGTGNFTWGEFDYIYRAEKM